MKSSSKVLSLVLLFQNLVALIIRRICKVREIGYFSLQIYHKEVKI